MGIVNSATLNALRTSFSIKFQGAISGVETQYNQIATVVPSTSKSNTYGWLGQMPEFKEWVGDRQFKNLQEHSYSIENKTFEASVVVKRDDIEDDNLGVYDPIVKMMGEKGVKFPDKQVFDLLNAGWTTLCYDGQNYFDTDHPVNATHDGSGADSSVPNVIIDPAYTGEPWYLLDVSQVLKPLIYQERRKLSLITKFNPNDESVYVSNNFSFGADLRCNAGFGFWQMAVGVKADLTLENVWAAMEMMGKFTFDGGEPMELNGTLLVVGNGNKRKALQLKNRENIAEGGTTVSNELQDMIEVLVSPRIKK